MKYGMTLAMIWLTMAVITSAFTQQSSRQSLSVGDNMAFQVTTIEVTSPAFKNGDRIPVKYTADGDDLSPPLNWQQVSGVREWTLICDDPDAPGGIFNHWIMYNIPSGYTGLPYGIPRDGELDDSSMQGMNSFGKIGYGGPSPPPGKPHRYIFKVYALDARMDLPSGITKLQLIDTMKGHVIAEGSLTGIYGR